VRKNANENFGTLVRKPVKPHPSPNIIFSTSSLHKTDSIRCRANPCHPSSPQTDPPRAVLMRPPAPGRLAGPWRTLAATADGFVPRNVAYGIYKPHAALLAQLCSRSSTHPAQRVMGKYKYEVMSSFESMREGQIGKI